VQTCRRITTGFRLGLATIAQSRASALQKICKCPVDICLRDICSRTRRAKSTGRALFKAGLSNCMQPPMSLHTVAKTLDGSHSVMAKALPCVACPPVRPRWKVSAHGLIPSARSACRNGQTMPMPARCGYEALSTAVY
jgi:hypothetical protein